MWYHGETNGFEPHYNRSQCLRLEQVKLQLHQGSSGRRRPRRPETFGTQSWTLRTETRDLKFQDGEDVDVPRKPWFWTTLEANDDLKLLKC